MTDGWYLDPFRHHRERYFTDGRPTDLVREGEHEGFDPPPELLLSSPLVPVRVRNRALGPRDLRRADDNEAQAAFDPRTASDRATSAMIRYGAGR